MAGQDNRLGAPTEGLGQNVTFSIGGGQRTPQAGAGQVGPMRMSMQGDGRANNTARGQAIPTIQDNGVMQTLLRFGEGIIKPKLEQARNEAFVTGMQRVATGEAVKEIVDEQPWYSQVFGDTPTVEGARAYAGFAKSQEVVTAIEADMDNLRSQSPDQFKQLISDRLTNINTGDLDTDLVVKQSLIKESGTLMKRHAKEHIGWQQDNFAKAQQGAQLAAASGLSATLGRVNKGSVDDMASGVPIGSTVDEGDELEKKISFARTFDPIPGVPIETTRKLHSATIGSILSQGNLHAFYTLEDAGIIEGLGPDASKRLRDQADRIESRKRAEMPVEFSERFAQIKSAVAFYDRVGVREKTNAAIEKLNTDWKAMTGAREPLISGKDQAEIQANLIVKQENAKRTIKESWARHETARAEGASSRGAADQEEEKSISSTLFIARQGGNIKDIPAPAVRAMWNGLNSALPPSAPVEARAVLYETRRAQAVNGVFDVNGQAFIRGSVNQALAENNVGLWHTTYVKEYLPLITPDGRHDAALAYFGEFGPQMHAYHSLRISDNDANSQVGGFNLVTKSTVPAKFSKDDAPLLKAVNSVAVNDRHSAGLFSSDKLTPESASDLANIMKPMVERLRGVDPEDAAKSVKYGLSAQGYEFVGGHMLKTNGGPRFADSLNAYRNQKGDNIGEDNLNAAVKGAVEKTAKKFGLRNVRPQYDLGPGNVPRLMVGGYNEQSLYVGIPLTIPEIHTHWVGKQPTVLGVSVNTDLPSPSASKAEWAAYRKQQATKPK